MPTSPRVSLVTLGCARNEVDSEEMAARLARGGWELVDDPQDADVAVVNTCGFIESAKKDSIDALLEAADLKDGGRTRKVVAVGCLAERYGAELAAELPEADAVLGFDDYPDLAGILADVLAGGHAPVHQPHDRRTLLPIAPVSRPERVTGAEPVSTPGHGVGSSTVLRTRLDSRPWAPLKIASGCDRRCAFCAIPAFRGSFVSRHPQELVEEAHWLVDHGVKELLLVSENTTSYGKDLPHSGGLEALLPKLAEVPGIERVRVSYLQPAEIRPHLLDVMSFTDHVVPYFDISFQHAAESVLRRMRRFGGTRDFLNLIEGIRQRVPQAGIRSNVIVGFPGETLAELTELMAFLEIARLDVVGVFGYSDEEGTEAAGYRDKLDPDEVEERRRQVADLVEELSAQRAQDRIGETVDVLVEEVSQEGQRPVVVGRAGHQGPDVDGTTSIRVPDGQPVPRVGDLVTTVVTDSEGVDLVGSAG